MAGVLQAVGRRFGPVPLTGPRRYAHLRPSFAHVTPDASTVCITQGMDCGSWQGHFCRVGEPLLHLPLCVAGEGRRFSTAGGHRVLGWFVI